MALIPTLTTVLAQTSGTSAADKAAEVARRAEKRLNRTCGEDGASWQADLCRSIWDGRPGQTGNKLAAETVHWLTTGFLSILLIFVVAWIVNRLARRCIVKLGRRVGAGGKLSRGLSAVRRITPDALLETREISVRGEQRREAVLGILKSVVTGLIYATAIFMALGEIGIDLAPLLAGAGVLGVALGFGAQTLVGDFLSGVFILVEDQYGVGDEVTFRPKSAAGEPVTGTVEALSLRNTRLRALDGTVWHVPNGELRAVGNQSQHWSRAVLDIAVAHGADIAKAKATIARVAEQVREHDASVLEPPEVWGVQALNPNGVTIRLVLKTTPSQQWRVTRLVRERILQQFAAEGIPLPVSSPPAGEALPSV
ncbi:mechanosensitive ion channel family protein [Patulibacter defluvii]|uniref:mechanosensitive ion channel family protein n=1 Tax=Patulibacter defluvii TaxID=3095358 RepID=UPI002A764888|nr:mechanosensitive ion channel family protein [Patulibacter sp. DM4]